MKTMTKLLNKIDELGWGVYDGDTYYEFEKYSPAGQGFCFEIFKQDDVKDFVDKIYEAYDNYDISYEASLWLDEEGHGKNGAPYDMKDVYEDMEWCKETILELYEDLKDWINN